MGRKVKLSLSSKAKRKERMLPSNENNISPFLEEDTQDVVGWDHDDDGSESSDLSSVLSSLTGTHVKVPRTAKPTLTGVDEKTSDEEKGNEDPLIPDQPEVFPDDDVTRKQSNHLPKTFFSMLSFGKGDGTRSIKSLENPKKSYRFYFLWGSLFVIVLIVVVVASVMTSKRNGARGSGSLEDDAETGLNPREKAIIEILESASPDSLHTLDSPQYKAKEFILYSDSLKLTPSGDSATHDRILQRFALAVFYYSTGGSEKWKENNWLFGDECSNLYWTGISCNDEDKVRALSFDDFGLEGTLPEEIGILTMLENLVVKNHPKLVGQIPTSIGKLSILGQLGLYNNELTGGIPHELYDATTLNYINLQNNQLEGGLILRIENLQNLEKLILFNNRLGGGIPVRQLSKTGIKFLGLSNNKFSGSLPDQISNLVLLEYLYLDNNLFTGTIPKSLGRLTNLIAFNLDHNLITGLVPTEIGAMKNLEYASMLNNTLNGAIPSELARLGELIILNMGTNSLTGSLPDFSTLRKLKQLHLFQNKLTGTLPDWLSRLNSLEVLFLSSNQFVGAIEPLFGGSLATSLQGLYLSDNSFEGSLSSELCSLTKLKALFFDTNQFVGTIPTCMGALSDLRQLYLFSNQLSGVVPPELSQMRNLNAMGLENNDLIGEVPKDVCAIETLRDVWADCGGDTPEVVCTCCTTCCPSPDCY